MSLHNTVCFVPGNDDGVPSGRRNISTIRSHAMLISSRQRRAREVLHLRNFRITTNADVAKVNDASRRTRKKPQNEVAETGKPKKGKSCCTRAAPPLEALRTIRLVVHHPYAAHISSAVSLPQSEVDSLLKSSAFRQVSEPLFVVYDIDGKFSMHNVFPECLKNTAFMQVLACCLYSAANNGTPTLQELRIKAKAIKSLSADLAACTKVPHKPLAGAILMLKGLAYRTNDMTAHHAHSIGIQHILDSWRTQGVVLNEEIARAIFWQDLDGACMTRADPYYTHETFPEIWWSRKDAPSGMNFELPIGFLAHVEVLGLMLCSILEEIHGFHLCMRNPAQRQSLSHAQIDNIQASIESRLVHCAQKLGNKETGEVFNSIEMCTSIAGYICCFAISCTCWGPGLIPRRLSHEILHILSSPSVLDQWHGHEDLLLWVVYVGFGATCQSQDYCFSGYMNLFSEMGKLEPWCAELFQRRKSVLGQFMWDARWFPDFERSIDTFCQQFLHSEVGQT